MVLHPCDAACTHAGYIDYQWLSPLLQYVICISQLAVCGMLAKGDLGPSQTTSLVALHG